MIGLMVVVLMVNFGWMVVVWFVSSWMVGCVSVCLGLVLVVGMVSGLIGCSCLLGICSGFWLVVSTRNLG